MGDFNLQELANTAWASATAGQNDALLFAALATAAERRMGDYIGRAPGREGGSFAVAAEA